MSFTMSTVTVARVTSGPRFISLVGPLLFLGLTTTRYPVSLALGALQLTVNVASPTSDNMRLVGAGMAGQGGGGGEGGEGRGRGEGVGVGVAHLPPHVA